MVERARQFPHISLKLTTEGTASSPSGRGRKQNPITAANFGNRQGHGNKLKCSLDSLILSWQDSQEKREEEGKPPLPEQTIPIILKIDPTAFDAEDLRKYGIEVIAELEDGYIIGASAGDVEFSKLQEKIEKFIKEEKGVKKVAEIWEILDSLKRPEYILSPELLEDWENIRDEQIYIVDIGVACIGTQSQLSKCPRREVSESDDKYLKRINTWLNKRDLTYQQWDDLKSEREFELQKFIDTYKGEIVSPIIDGDIPVYSELSDSFSCRIKISGNGLKDLVLNFPYIFDVSEPDEFVEIIQKESSSDREPPPFQLQAPESNAPKVCIIDSGIQERHSLLREAIDSQYSISWVPGKTGTADYVRNGGHGTRVAGAVLYPRTIPHSGNEKAICWLQNARVLDENCKLSERLFPPSLLEEIVENYCKQKNTRIFNHSITGSVPCRTQQMSAWAAAIDNLTWKNDILFIVAAGNLPLNGKVGTTRFSVREHLSANRAYPDYLLENSCRIANPAQSFQALTVGSISPASYHLLPYSSISEKDRPSAFSCSGLGIWETIKPEVVEYGGDLVKDEGTPPNIVIRNEVCPELVRSTLYGGPAVAADNVGTSFTAPKISHIAACIAAELPDESCLLYRALIVQSARWPAWTNAYEGNQLDIVRQMGYGLPNLERALGNSSSRITLITRGECRIKAKQAHVYQVKLPEKLRSQGDELKILLEITLSYKAQPRRTRRNRRKYLSTWLDWDCSKKGEDPEYFLARILAQYDTPEDAERGEGIFKWMLGQQNNYGTIKDVSRSAGTIQKDWTVANSFELTDAFCIAVVGHEGWNNDPDAEVPYSLVVSFEAVGVNIPIYTAVSEAQAQIEVTQQVKV